MNRIHQIPNDLVLAVFTSELATPVTILRQREVNAGSWHFTFRILAESHQVEVRFDGAVIFQELLLCSQQILHDPVHCHRFHDLGAHHYATPDYRVSVRFNPPGHWQSAQSGEATLAAEFPEVYNQIPTTQIIWSRTVDTLRWRTLHVYAGIPHSIEVASESELLIIK